MLQDLSPPGDPLSNLFCLKVITSCPFRDMAGYELWEE